MASGLLAYATCLIGLSGRCDSHLGVADDGGGVSSTLSYCPTTQLKAADSVPETVAILGRSVRAFGRILGCIVAENGSAEALSSPESSAGMMADLELVIITTVICHDSGRAAFCPSCVRSRLTSRVMSDRHESFYPSTNVLDSHCFLRPIRNGPSPRQSMLASSACGSF